MTWKKLLQMIAQGYGSGHGNDYKPFLRITRRNTSKVSNQSAGNWLFGYTREFHYFARTERQIALGLWWLGAKDIREQFPLWPMGHRHPLIGAVDTEGIILPEAPGLMDLAKQAGIDHGVFPGSNVPYVATMDLMVTVVRKRVPSLVAIPCKPRDLISAADPASRMLERMELERLFCDSLKIPRRVADQKVFSRPLIANLEWLSPSPKVATDLRQLACFCNFSDMLNRDIYRNPVDRTVEAASKKLGWSRERGNQAFRLLAWEQSVDIDLTQPVVMTEPALAGGRSLRKMLQTNIFGAIDDE